MHLCLHHSGLGYKNPGICSRSTSKDESSPVLTGQCYAQTSYRGTKFITTDPSRFPADNTIYYYTTYDTSYCLRMVLHWAMCISEESQQHTQPQRNVIDAYTKKHQKKKQNKYAIVRYFSDRHVFSHAFSILNRNTKVSEPDVRSDND